MFFAKKKKVIKTKKQSDVLDKLNRYVQQNTKSPAKLLVSFWSDQQIALTYKEINQAILDGELPKETIENWIQDYTLFVTSTMQYVWKEAIHSSIDNSKLIASLTTFQADFNSIHIDNWIKTHTAEFVTNVTNVQAEAIKTLIKSGIDNNMDNYELARFIRPCVGLDKRQATANLRYYNNIKEKLAAEHPRMKPENIEKKANEARLKYASRQHRQRADTIAQTEITFAYNHGEYEGVLQAREEGVLQAKVIKRWSTSGGPNVCSDCEDLDGMEVGIAEEFPVKGRKIYSGQWLIPPLHPRCMCGIEYEEERE